MKRIRFVEAAILAFVVAILTVPDSSRAQSNPPFERTENRAACSSYEALRQPFFGETHLHTSYSFDAYTLSTRNDPDAAYAFAKGAPVTLPAADARAGKPQTRTAQLRQPLDFAAVTDHSELFGEMQICTRSRIGTPGRGSFQCRQMRTGEVSPGKPDTFNPTLVTTMWAVNPIARPNGAGPVQPLCSGANCSSAAVSMWQAIQKAAEDAYDRTSDCSFTSFIGYEYTAQPLGSNLHRNVIFRNANVPKQAISNVSTGGPYPTVLWEMLRDQCVDKKGKNCDVLTIPHNANLSGGIMFPDPANVKEAKERAFFEPLTEIYQHKAASECRYDRLAHYGVETKDPLCTFEQAWGDLLAPQPNPPDIYNYPPRNMIRNVLKDGMALATSLHGVNPFKYGIIGGTDSHNGDPGNTVEEDFQGHAGSLDAPYAGMLDNIRLSPGALAVVWAEENTRDSIFSAMRRKETYATSGTRPIVRFFGGWNYNTKEDKLCNQSDRVAVGYAKGVPMGGDLPDLPASSSKPRFLVAALRDPESAKLQRVQIIKGWVDDGGGTHEKVYDVAGEAKTYSQKYYRRVCDVASYRKNTTVSERLSHIAQPTGETAPVRRDGSNELCTVWKDKKFDPDQPAFYYARVLETPTCRWSSMACLASGVNPFAGTKKCNAQADRANAKAVLNGDIAAGATPFSNCCLTENNDPYMERTIQERAWTSPVWYAPND